MIQRGTRSAVATSPNERLLTGQVYDFLHATALVEAQLALQDLPTGDYEMATWAPQQARAIYDEEMERFDAQVRRLAAERRLHIIRRLHQASLPDYAQALQTGDYSGLAVAP